MKKNESKVISLAERRTKRKKSGNPWPYRLGMAIQAVVLVVGGYLVLRSCGLAK